MRRGRAPRHDLLVLLRSRDGAGFLELLALYAAAFRDYFIWVRRIPEAEAGDLACELVEDVALGKIDKYAGDLTGFNAWMWKLAKNVACDWWRKRRGSVSDRDSATLASVSEPEVFPDIPKIQAVREALWELSEEDRQVLTLRHGDARLSWKEIAERLAVSNGAARTRYTRARIRLGRLLENDPRLTLSGVRPERGGTALYA